MALFQALGADKEPKQPKQGGERSTTNKVLRYAMLPEILPRIRGLGIHFGHFAYLLALVFNSARLIPNAHPVMNAANIGRYGVRQVIALAANNITWSKNNIDQIAIFSAIIIGILMIAIQAVLIGIAAISSTALAAPSAESFFTTEEPSQDVVLQALNLVFGRPPGASEGLFGPISSEYSGLSGNYSQIHETVYQILSLYSMATMVIAVIIVLYYILTVIGEAAQSGTPFGRRFNSLWAPIRLVIALGLLVPLGSGLNSAQYITLWTAKMGSGLATQAWYIFFDNIVNQDPSKYVVTDTKRYDLTGLVYDIFLSEVCTKAYNKHNAGSGVVYARSAPIDIGNGFKIVWAASPADQVPEHRVSCGELSVNPASSTSLTGQTDDPADGGDELVPIPEITALVKQIVTIEILPTVEELAQQYADYKISVGGSSGENPIVEIKQTLDDLSESASESYTEGIESIYTTAVSNNLAEKLAQDRNKGWAYAGVWYLQIGRMMQQLENPKTTAIPSIRLPESATASGQEESWGEFFFGTDETYAEVDGAVNSARAYLFRPDRLTAAETRALMHTESTSDGVADTAYEACVGLDSGSNFLDRIKCMVLQVFVPDELFAISAGTTLDPMASLVSAGSSIFERAAYLGMAGLAMEAAGSWLSSIPGLSALAGGILDGLGGIILVVAMIGFSAGIVLYFLLPILPFVYFFFAIISWFMEIFEAVIAMPLWALAHLRIDGDGMPGGAAINGYFLLLSILLRPFLIVIGLISGYLIFIAGIYFLSLIFNPMLNVTRSENVAGFEIMVFTAIFTFLCYNIGLTAFKMVDTIPSQILRWIGSSASTFNDGKGDIAGSTQGAVIASAAIGSQMVHQAEGAAKGAGRGARQGLYKTEEEKGQERAAVEQGWLRHAEMQDKGINPETGGRSSSGGSSSGPGGGLSGGTSGSGTGFLGDTMRGGGSGGSGGSGKS